MCGNAATEPLARVGQADDSFSVRENLPEIPRSPNADAELRQAIPFIQERTVDENPSEAESLYDIRKEEDTGFKRKARLQGMRMRILYGPELTYLPTFIDAEDESGTRQTLGATMPLNEIWEGALFDHLSFFSLKSGNNAAGRDSLRLRAARNPGKTFRPWLALVPYANFGDTAGEGLGLEAGFSKTWSNGARLAAEIFAWRPWDEGYHTIVEDGRKHGAALNFGSPLTENLIISGRAYYEELELGPGAKSGQQYAGNRHSINARAYYRLLQRKEAYMDYGFRDDDLWNEFLVGCEMGVYLHVDYQRYFKPSGFHALNPVPEVFAQEIGVAFQYAFSPRFGLVGEGFLGRDPDRDLQFGELAGVNGRLVMLANPHIRLWVGGGYTKTNTSLESSGGEETSVSCGITYAF